MKITNKIESINKINELKINRFPEELFHREDDKKIIEFINQYKAKYYAIRSKEIVDCADNHYQVLAEDVLEYKNHFKLFTINVSSYNYTNHLVIIGDVFFSSNNDVWLIASKNKNYTGRMAEQNPDYNFKTDIFDKKLNDIPGFDSLYSYISSHHLIDCIVEFALYNIPVGIYQEKVIVFEIRTDF